MMIRVVNLRKSFGDQAILRGVDLMIPKGKITTIIGRSGGGKSILLKHLIGLIRSGSYEELVQKMRAKREEIALAP